MEIASMATIASISTTSAMVISGISGITESILPDKVAPHIHVDDKNYESKPFVICLYKDLPRKEYKLLELYGPILMFDEAFNNCKLNYAYLILDFRIKTHFDYYNLHIRGNEDDYNIILYRHNYEHNNGISFHNELIALPERQLTKKMFDKLLLQEVVHQPKSYISFLRSLFSSCHK